MQKQKKQLLSAVCMTLFISLLCACAGKTIAPPPPAAQKGIMDLRHWDFDKNGAVKLKGEWEFYWEKLISPDQFEKNNTLTFEYMNAPSSWNKYEIAGKKLSGAGFATYRLKVITSEKSLGLKILTMSSSSRVYVNGRLISASGFPASTKEQTIPFYEPSVTVLENNSEILDIVVHVSNFHHYKGGMWGPVNLGKIPDLQAEREEGLVISSLFFGAICIIGLYHIIIFLIRKKDKSSLLFGLFCLLEGFQTILLGERYFVTIFPEIEFWVFVKLVYLSMYCAVPVFIWYMKTIFPDDMSDSFVKGALFIGTLLASFVLFFPSYWFTMSLPVFRIFTICLAVYATVVLTKAILNKRPGVMIFLTGFIILTATVLNDMFSDRILIPFGLFSFLFSQAFLIAQRYSLAFSTIEQQREALKIENHQRKIVENHLIKSEEKYRKMIELLPIPFCEFDLNFNLLYANKAALDWLGYTKKDYQSGINISFLLEDSFMESLSSRIKIEKPGQKASLAELKLKRKDGSELSGQATTSVMFKNAEPFAFRTCFVDLSEQKEARNKLAKYQEKLRELSSQISLAEEKQRRSIACGLHDQAGQSLALIRMKLNELADCDALKNQSKKFNDIIKFIDQTINEIRDLTFDLSPPELYQFGLEIALESLCQRKSKLYNIPIHFYFKEKSIPLHESDSILVYQSARELLFNVIKHARATKIQIFTQSDNNNIEVVIEDNGIGFDTNLLNLKKSINNGYGLFSIQERMNHRGGSFFIKSTPGKGTKATLRVPLKKEPV